MLITQIMGLTTFILCLIVGCKSDYLRNSRFSESGESSESIYPQASDFYMTQPRPQLISQDPSNYYTRSRYFNTGPSPFINHHHHHQPPPQLPPHHSSKFHPDRMMINHGYSESRPISLKPQVIAEHLPVSYDGASLSDRNPLIHLWRSAPSSLSSSSLSSDSRAEPISNSEYGYAESSAHSAVKHDADDDGDDGDENENLDSQESKDHHDYSVENTQSSSTEQSDFNSKHGTRRIKEDTMKTIP